MNEYDAMIQETSLNKYYAIDIETMPNDVLIDKLPEVKASKTLKDPEKIKSDIEKKQSEQVSKMALSPLYGKIACIGIYGSDGTKKCLFGSEEDMITELLNIISKPRTKVITYNGKNFDFPFIFRRAAILGIKPLYQMDGWTNRFKAYNHIDIMAEWCAVYGESMKLDTLADVIFDKGKIEFDVTNIKDLIKTEKGKKELEEYCMRDVEITYELAKRFGYIN